MKNNGILMLVLVFMLPLSAADSPKNKQIPIGETLCELVIHNGMIAPNELIRFPCISKYVNSEASKKLNDHRLTLKNYVEQRYPATRCEVTYSPNRLEAAVIENDVFINLGIDTQDGKGIGPLTCLWSVYFKNAKKIQSKKIIGYRKSKRDTDCPPFFTKTHACFDFGTDVTMTMIYDATKTTGLCWNRITKDAKDPMATRFFVHCENRYLPTGYFARVLPGLYAKIMKKADSFAYKRAILFYQPPQPGSNIAKWVPVPAFTINLVQTDILTEDDVHILSLFLPGGKYAKWFDIPKKYGYYLLNMLACYGSSHALLDEIDAQVGKYKTKWKNVGNVQASCCTEHIEVLTNNTIISFIRDDIFKRLNDTAIATLDYIAQLKKEGIFVEKDWHHKTDLKKRVKLYNQAIKFLRHKRMTWKTQDHYLIRYDCLNNRVTVLHKLAHNLSAAVEKNVPSTIDFDSITVCYDATKPLGMNGYTIQYQLYKTAENNEDSESSDVLVESSDEE